MPRGVFTGGKRGRSAGRIEAGACGDLQALAPTLVRWEEIARSIESSLPQIDGRNWYAPASTARMIKSYFVRRWSGRKDLQGTCVPATEQFDYFFEHYQLKEIAIAQIERQLQAFGIALQHASLECRMRGLPAPLPATQPAPANAAPEAPAAQIG